MTRSDWDRPWVAFASVGVWVFHANVSPAFTPVRSELVDVAGFSRGLLNFVVLRPDRSFPHPAPSAVVLVALLLLLVGMLPRSASRPRMPALAFLAAAGFLAAVAVSGLVTSYRVVLAERTFALALVALAAPRIAWMAERIIKPWLAARAGSHLPIVCVGLMAAGFFASMMLQTLATYGGNYSGFLHLSRDVAARAEVLAGSGQVDRLVLWDQGYDGEFMYLMAFDPLLSRFRDDPRRYQDAIDDPPYRYGRIGFSALTRLVAGGSSERFPAVMMWLIVAAHAGLGAAAGAVASRSGVSVFAGLVYLAIPSFAASLLFGLPEALAACAMVVGFACWRAEQFGWAALSLAAGLLVRETGLVLLGALVVATAFRARRSAGLLALAVAPAAGWRLFAAARLFPAFGWHSLFANPADLTLPLAGLGQLWRAGVLQTQAAPEVAAAVVFPVLLMAAAGVGVGLFIARPGPLEAAAAIYGLVAVSLNYSKIWRHLPSGERGVFELFVCLLLCRLTTSEGSRWMRRVLDGLFVALAIYTYAISPEAAASRTALLLVR